VKGFGAARLRSARLRSAMRGAAGHGSQWLNGIKGNQRLVTLGWVRHGLARRGKVVLGTAGRGMIRRGTGANGTK